MKKTAVEMETPVMIFVYNVTCVKSLKTLHGQKYVDSGTTCGGDFVFINVLL